MIYVICGMIGSLLMYVGDMFLYFFKEEIKGTYATKQIIETMTRFSYKRIMIGSLLAIPACIFNCIGILHLNTIAISRVHARNGMLLLLVFFISGAIYHSQFMYYGILNRFNHTSDLDDAYKKYMHLLKNLVFGMYAASFLYLAFMIGFCKTILPWWYVFFTPLLVFLWIKVLKKLKQPLYMLLVGGWGNLPIVIYYGAVFGFLMK